MYILHTHTYTYTYNDPCWYILSKGEMGGKDDILEKEEEALEGSCIILRYRNILEACLNDVYVPRHDICPVLNCRRNRDTYHYDNSGKEGGGYSKFRGCN